MADKQVEVNTPVQFDDSSTNATSYAWNFGDGNTSIEKSPSHTYTTISPPGYPYNVVHTVTNDCGPKTCPSKTVEVVAELPPSGGGSPIIVMLAAAAIGFMMMVKK